MDTFGKILVGIFWLCQNITNTMIFLQYEEAQILLQWAFATQ